MKRTALTLALALILSASAAWAETIKEGQIREAVGVIKAVTLASRTVVVDAPTAKGALTIGAVADAATKFTISGKPGKIEALAVGKSAAIKYTRVGDALKLLSLEVR